MKTISITYEIVTAESAEQGEAAERGFYQPGGWHYPPDEDGDYPDDLDEYDIQYDDIRELAEAAIWDGFEVVGGTAWLIYSGDDWTAQTADGEYGCEQRHLHKGDDITDEEWARVRAWVAAGKVPEDDDDDDDDDEEE